MNSYFPIPYSDESLYSIIARHSTHTCALSFKATNDSLFNKSEYAASSATDLPYYLLNLSKKLNDLSVNKILYEHTLWPFYKNFVYPRNIARIENKIIKSDTYSIHMTLGLNSSMYHRDPTPKYCPICVVEDRRIYGEAYWHRAHLIPEIRICPLHKCYLESPENHLLFKGRNTFVSAEESIKYLTPTICQDSILIALAYNLSRYLWIVVDNCRYFNYKEKLDQLGYVKLNRKLDIDLLSQDMRP